MEPTTIYYNPRCSKSRTALALLKENGVNPEIIYYLENPLTTDELKILVAKLDLKLRDILRTSEPDYKDLGLNDESLSEENLFEIATKHPRLIQRPILVQGDRAILGRNPEKVLNLFAD
ncbi:MAG: arsenate reductase (glutaredoxin) [Pseudomonadota bacterium]|nr:arsenate reductase (glutaredoxin) [Pseudomonadota bacterium]